MSIWASQPVIGHDDDEVEPRGDVRSYIVGWSNHYPDHMERPSAIDLAHIPAWCVPGHGDHTGQDGDDVVVGPWLRLSIDTVDHHIFGGKVVVGRDVHVSVVLDEAAVNALIDDLIEWRDTPKVHPQ
jgi:hypothetical protein